MSHITLGLVEPLAGYLRSVSVRDDADFAALRAETATHARGRMQISPEQGQFMTLLLRLLRARKTLEIGVFTGYSAMVAAKAVGPQGRVVALDISEDFTAVARRHWAQAGIADRIDLRIAPALASLEAIGADQNGTFDFVFIDADKENYAAYYEHGLRLLRQGGLIAIDNVLWGGRVINAEDQTADTIAIRALNAQIHNDTRVESSMLPIGDGLTLALKL